MTSGEKKSAASDNFIILLKFLMCFTRLGSSNSNELKFCNFLCKSNGFQSKVNEICYRVLCLDYTFLDFWF